ncbi:hypothetical protein XENTR_v10024621 [Xenopus tropicalis]|nr:hypothetical protein XENTR_v10024621 [Xenopus tropicalis]
MCSSTNWIPAFREPNSSSGTLLCSSHSLFLSLAPPPAPLSFPAAPLPTDHHTNTSYSICTFTNLITNSASTAISLSLQHLHFRQAQLQHPLTAPYRGFSLHNPLKILPVH